MKSTFLRSLVVHLLISSLSTAFVSSLVNSHGERGSKTFGAFVTHERTPGAANIAGAFLISSLLIGSPAFALDPQIYNNEYADPFHPLCERRVQVSENGKTFHYSGTAVGPKGDTSLRGCSRDEIKKFGLRNGAFDGEILQDGRFSAGDGVHEGIWEPKGTAATNLGYEDVDGIRWNDGNKWVVKSQSRIVRQNGKNVVKSKGAATAAGEAIFYAYIGFSTLAGAKGLYDGMQRRKNDSN